MNLAPKMSGMWGIVLQKSPSELCEIEICNYRIGASVLLNRCCVFRPDLESIFLAEMLEILLQHNQGQSGLDMLVMSLSAHDPGCVKTREAFVGAQQKNRTC